MQQRTNPGFLAAETFNRVVFGSHPGGARVADRGDARRDHAATRWSSSTRRATCRITRSIAFAGDISLAEARKLVEAKLGGWKKAGVAQADGRGSAGRSVPPKVYLVAPPGLGADDADRRRRSR